MMSRRFMHLVLVANVLFLLCHLDKQRHVIAVQQQQEDLKRQLAQFQAQHATLVAELSALQDPQAVRHYAQSHLHMRQISKDQCKACSDYS